MIEQIDISIINKIAKKAGLATLEIYKQDFEVIKKEDDSPLTMADKNSNDIIIAGLKKHYPKIPIISEETKLLDYNIRKDWDYFWLIDPLDGTKEFVKKNGEFTINIALVKNNTPILGVIYVPVQETLFYAIEDKGSFRINKHGEREFLKIKPLDKYLLKVVASRSHNSPEVIAYVEDMKKSFDNVEFVAAGSSLKFCLIAEGKADVYPRLAPTMEWDTGAGHIIAKEAGALVLDYNNNYEMIYNKENLLNPHFIVKNPNL